MICNRLVAEYPRSLLGSTSCRHVMTSTASPLGDIRLGDCEDVFSLLTIPFRLTKMTSDEQDNRTLGGYKA